MSVGAALLRFWWIVVAGAVVGVAAAAGLFSRQPAPIYTANDTIYVTSASQPYLRTLQPQASTRPAASAQTKARSGGTTLSTPDTTVLVNAANLYPLLIESGQITKLRESRYGDTKGRVTATAFASATNTYGVYHPSPLPVIVVKATSRYSATATKVAADTVKAFSYWVTQHQQAARIPQAQRIQIQQLSIQVTSAKRSSIGLPVFVGGIVLLAFCGVAVLADRVRPRRERVPAASHNPV